MKTSERRAIADRALSEIEKLELEIRAKMVQNNIQGDLNADYADFKAYSSLRGLHEQYSAWKQEYAAHADNAELVNLVGQSEHDILRENYPQVTSETEIISVVSTDTLYLYEHDSGTGRNEKTRYTLQFEKVKVLSFHSYYHDLLKCLFIRVNRAGMPT